MVVRVGAGVVKTVWFVAGGARNGGADSEVRSIVGGGRWAHRSG